ncbi:TetR/AcrR family transcriptional regulator [Nocardia sp. NPDC051981]|uniref:TetR/AcrR family transcriptional regulator n=1 Tax=Nocardia sp. NPDC051981 TaxID=3155417 RepID=UPI00342720FD
MPQPPRAVGAPVAGRSAGRPRDTARHDAVLAATRELLAEVGYTGVNYSEVSTRAGVTRQLLYRWWPTRADLVSEALFANPEDRWPVDYPGSLAADLRVFVTALVDYALRPDVRAGILGLMSEADRITEVPGLESGTLEPLESELRTLVDRAVARGEIPQQEADSIDIRLTLNTVRGAVVMHLIADRTPPAMIVDHLTQLLRRAFACNC